MRRHTPFEDVEAPFDRMGRGFDAGWFDAGWFDADRSAGGFEVDVRAADEQVVVMADLPGFEREAIDVSLDDRTLTIAVERVAVDDDRDGDYVRRERRHESATRRLRLPAAVDGRAAEASYNNGVLTVSLPRTDADDDGVHIDVA